jgi:hypothetical protein
MRGLNSRPLRYKHNALPTELMELMHTVGFEPTKPKHGILRPAPLTKLGNVCWFNHPLV